MNKFLLAVSLLTSVFFGATAAQAFNPQPDPPGVQGE
jgi:hypothetical protein